MSVILDRVEPLYISDRDYVEQLEHFQILKNGNNSESEEAWMKQISNHFITYADKMYIKRIGQALRSPDRLSPHLHEGKRG